jgi:hypothetical protein
VRRIGASLIAALALAGCGDDDGSGGSAIEPTWEQVRQAALADPEVGRSCRGPDRKESELVNVPDDELPKLRRGMSLGCGAKAVVAYYAFERADDVDRAIDVLGVGKARDRPYFAGDAAVVHVIDPTAVSSERKLLERVRRSCGCGEVR